MSEETKNDKSAQSGKVVFHHLFKGGLSRKQMNMTFEEWRREMKIPKGASVSPLRFKADRVPQD